MNYLMFIFLVANLAYLIVKLFSETSDEIKQQYRHAFMSSSRLLPLVSYVFCLTILVLNYLSLKHPTWEMVNLLGPPNSLLLTAKENLFLLAISAFLLTPAAQVIAVCMLLHLALRFSLLYLDGIAQHNPSYFILMGALSVLLISIDKFSTEGVPWLRRIQRRMRSFILYTMAFITLVSYMIILKDPEVLRLSLKLSKDLNMTFLLVIVGLAVMIGWYQVLISNRHKDTLLLLVVPSLTLMSCAFDIGKVHLVFPLFTMVSLAICMHDDYCRDRIALAKKMRVLDMTKRRRVRPAFNR